jgi:branched-chain amino acid transport system substrate-binding protein
VEGNTIRIVVEGPMSGEQAATGIDMWNAATLAADKANSSGGIDGKQVELIRGDDKADPATGVALANKYAGQVFAVIGPYNSSVGIENLPIWIKGGTVPIHLTSNADTDGMGYTVQPKDYQVAPIEAKAISDWLQASSASILYDTSTYTAGIAKQVNSALKSDGVAVPVYESFNANGFDKAKAQSLLTHVGSGGKLRFDPTPVFYSSSYYPQGGEIAAAANATEGSDGLCFMGLANQDPAFVKASGLAAARNCFFSGVPSAEQFPAAKQYVTDYKAKFGSDPGTWGTFTYDSVNMLFEAAKRAGSWDAQKVRDELSATKNYPGATGDITIDPKTGNRTNVPVVILIVDKHGNFVIDPKWAKFAGFSL